MLLYKSAKVKLTACGTVLLKTVVLVSGANVSQCIAFCVSYGIPCSDGYFLFHDGLEQGACSCDTVILILMHVWIIARAFSKII